MVDESTIRKPFGYNEQYFSKISINERCSHINQGVISIVNYSSDMAALWFNLLKDWRKIIGEMIGD